jgi:hypothetical protein
VPIRTGKHQTTPVQSNENVLIEGIIFKNFGKKSAEEVFQALKIKFNIVLPSLKS